jgi:hypothetical protein
MVRRKQDRRCDECKEGMRETFFFVLLPFCVLRVDEHGEKIPVTLSPVSPD